MTAAAVLAAELRAGYAGSWDITGLDRAAEFGEDLARRGVRTLAGAKLRQVGTVKVPGPTLYQHDNATETFTVQPAYVVDFAGGPSLGYGDGFKGYAEATLQADRMNAIARSTAGDGAVLLTVTDTGGGRPGFAPYWQTTSDKGDIVASIIGIGAVISAGLLAGAAGGAGAAGAAAPGAASSAGAVSIDAAFADLAASLGTLAPEGAAALVPTGAQVAAYGGGSLLAGGVLGGGIAAAGAAAGASSVLDRAWQSLQDKLTGAAAKAASIKLTQALVGGGAPGVQPSVGRAVQPAGSSSGLWLAAGAVLAVVVAVL